MRRMTLAATVLFALVVQGGAGRAWAAEVGAGGAAVDPVQADAPAAVAVAGPMVTESAAAGPGAGAVPVAPSEQALLAAQEALAPHLQETGAAGCQDVWDNEEQRVKKICGSPVRVAIGGALVGGLLGGLLSGPPGILIGAPIGALLGYYAETNRSGF